MHLMHTTLIQLRFEYLCIQSIGVNDYLSIKYKRLFHLLNSCIYSTRLNKIVAYTYHEYNDYI